MDFYTEILTIKKEKKLNNKDLGSYIGYTSDAFRMALKRKSLSDLEIEKLKSELTKTEQTDLTKSNVQVSELERRILELETDVALLKKLILK